MARTKILVSAAAVGRRRKPFHVNVAGGTTCAQVVVKVLEKLQCSDPPLRYQLWAVAAERGKQKTNSSGHCCTRPAVYLLISWSRPTV